MDFNRVDIEAPTNWLSLDIAGLDTLGCCFDAVVSFSSLEHDGLGRYGGMLMLAANRQGPNCARSWC